MLFANIDKLILNRNNSQTVLLSNVSFTLSRNQIYTIVGKNGTGKSTLIKALTGLLDQRFYTVHGKVIFNESDILTIDPEMLLSIRRRKIKYVFQDAKNSFDQLKTLRYYFNQVESSAEEIDETFNYFLLPRAQDLFNLYPYEISGGMAQRVSLALALLAKPEVIILDEPTSGIDSAIANLFLLKLKEFAEQKGGSVLLVTQDLTFANMISDKIALITDRHLTSFLPPQDFYKSQEIISADELINSYLQLVK
jgi:ABC-type glutathione transport system ATPase component